MKTNHTIYIVASQQMTKTKYSSIDLVVTSPPYPMIEMWDEIMASQNPDISNYPETGESYDWNFEMSFDNWRIPIAFTISPTGWMRFNVGPQLSFCSKGEIFDTKAQEYGGQVRYKLSRKEYNVFDIQAVAGVDFRFYQRFVIGLRYVYGFSKVLKDNFGMDYEIMNAGKSYHRAATITFGLEF